MIKKTDRMQNGRQVRERARIEYLRVENYRALHAVEFKNLTPLTVLLGSNGSGKSTVFDVFNFLSECFQFGLRHAWDRRGRARELKTRGQEGPIVIELKYRERPRQPIITYHLAINENRKGPFVTEEWLQWRRGTAGKLFRFLEYREGMGQAVSGEMPDEQDQRVEAPLRSADLIAVNTLGQFAEHPRVAALREFITDWYVSYLSIEVYPHQCKDELLTRLPDRLRGYASWLPSAWRILVLVDRDGDDCRELKKKLEKISQQVGLKTKSTAHKESYAVVNRLAIEELEAWYFGDWRAVKCAYPRVPGNIPLKAKYRDPDAIKGGTWEAFESILNKAGYFAGGLRKIEAARAISPYMVPEENRSRSFNQLRSALRELQAE